MKSITCLYDVKNWAVFNVLTQLSNAFGEELKFNLIHYKEYYSNPFETDIIYISFLFLYNSNFPYKHYAKEVYLYSHSGQFLKRLGAKGQGPGEYKDVSNIVVDDQGFSFLFEKSRNVIHLFNKTGAP